MEWSVHFSSIPFIHTHINPQTLSLKGYIKRDCKLYIIHIASFPMHFYGQSKEGYFLLQPICNFIRNLSKFPVSMMYKQYIKKYFFIFP